MAKSRASEVYDFILDKLFAGELRPGQTIDRQEISRQSGMSVGTVLIAMNMLEVDGFVETIARKGTLVRSVGFVEVYGQLLVREALETEAARLYCGTPLNGQLKKLASLARKLDSVKQFDSSSIHMDATFHSELIALTGNQFFIGQYARIMKLSTFYSFLQFVPGLSQPVRDSHVQLLERLATATPDEAESAIRNHIRKGRPQFFPPRVE